MDVLRFLRDHSIPHWTEGKNTQRGWVNIQCPLCPDHSNHGGFNLTSAKLYYHCWHCGWSPLSKVVAKLVGTDRQHARELIDLYAGKSILPEIEKIKKPLIIPGGPIQQIHRNYLIKRHFDPDFITQKYGILGTGPVGKFRFRLIMPITYDKKEVSFHSRDITGIAQPKYKACPKEQELIHHKEIFYGLDFIHDTIIIVEGPLDVWRVGDGALATFGVSFTQKQIELLIALRPKRVFVMYDAEPSTAQEQAQKLSSILSSFGLDTHQITLEQGDPCDLTNDEVKHLRKEIGL